MHEKDSNEEKILHALYKIRTSPRRMNVFIIANTVRTGLDEVNKVLKPLVDKGLIRQDSRDCKGPFDLDSTYYTVRNKRDEIDQLLREDTEKVQTSEEELNFSGAGNSDRVPACVNCFIYYKKGTTFCRKCFSDVVDLDKQIADIIFCLNRKGYRTEFCCAGHGGVSEPYIRFAIDIDGINLPLNFEGDREKNSRTFRMIPYHKAMGITRKKMQQTVSEEILEQYRLDNLETLRDWAKNLPIREE